MNRRPLLHAMWRVQQDVADCLKFIKRQPGGKPRDRKLDIHRGIAYVHQRPTVRRVMTKSKQTGVPLRRHSAAQFVIVYAYSPPDAQRPDGIVSVRAIRHRRVRDVFRGVKEPMLCYG